MQTVNIPADLQQGELAILIQVIDRERRLQGNKKFFRILLVIICHLYSQVHRMDHGVFHLPRVAGEA